MTFVPNPDKLLKTLELTFPLIGIYDAPEPTGFEPLVSQGHDQHICLFKFYHHWQEGHTLHLTRETAGCGGSAHWFFGKETRTREEFVKFLAITEGLKDTPELIDRWLDHEKPYKNEYPHLLIGPLKTDKIQYLKTVTFFVTPDQLSALCIGAHYYHSPDDILPPIISPMGSGCMQMLPLLKDLDFPQALIGSMDIVMRHFLPPEIIAFTVTLPMFKQLCQLDEHSFLHKPFLRNLKTSRGEKGISAIA
jgi:hypothetical protein